MRDEVSMSVCSEIDTMIQPTAPPAQSARVLCGRTGIDQEKDR